MALAPTNDQVDARSRVLLSSSAMLNVAGGEGRAELPRESVGEPLEPSKELTAVEKQNKST